MQRLSDVVFLLPGIMGSVLRRNGEDVWAPSVNGLLNAILSAGEDIQALTLTDDPVDKLDLDDGVTVGGIMPTAHIFPGLWKIDGYSETSAAIRSFLADVNPGKNFFEFGYDWRRDNRVAAKKLKLAADTCLQQWRSASGNSRAKLILIGHSMGGLVARYFLEVLGGWRDTRALITFGTPYSGSLNALNFLANGYKKAWGIVDLSKMVRSFTSIYQLLPTYKCCDFGDGTLCHVDDARGIPNVRADKIAAALAFHKEIAAAVAANNKLEEYRTSGYKIYPVVGTHQSTLQSARIPSGANLQVELLANYLGQDHGGDGTVPRVSATPAEWTDATQGMFSAAKHASLQNAQPVLDHLEGVLSGMYMEHAVQRVPLGRGRGEQLVHLRVDVDDAFEQIEPILVKAYPDAENVLLRAVIQDAQTGIVVSAESLKTVEGVLTAEFAPLSKGTYRITVAGDQRVLPVTDLFEVFPGVAGSRRSPGIKSARPIVVGERLEDILARDAKVGTRGAVPVKAQRPPVPRAAAPPPVTHAATPPRAIEGTSVTRYPSIQIEGDIEPEQFISLSIDLARFRDELTESTTIDFTAPEDWKQFAVGVHIVAPDLEFKAGEDSGEIVVQNGADSIPLKRSVRVASDLGGRDHIEVRASFVYNGRVCGSARRGFSVVAPAMAAVSVAPGTTREIPGSSASSARTTTATAPAASARTTVAAPSLQRKLGEVVIPETTRKAAPVGETAGNCQIAPGVTAPKMTIEMFHSEGMPAGMFLWHIDCPDQVRAECTLPSNLCATVNLGADAPEFVAELFAGCERKTPPDHMLFFEGLGEKLYEKTPTCFREIYWAMADRYGSDFPIQIMSDDPYVPWELMRPYRGTTASSEFLCFTHPVARWFIDQEGKGGRQALLPTGIVGTIVPDYRSRPELQALAAAQREKEAIEKMLTPSGRVQSIEGQKNNVVSALEDNSGSNICLLHYAGHGDCDTSKTDFARLSLEDNDLEVLEVRRSATKLGRHRHALVFLNACRVGRSGLNMGVIGGFAEALMHCDFGGLIAPLWAVYDDSAATASTEFIRETVLNNKTFAEVLREIRKTYGPDCPTFLSYLYYGDVMAKFS